MAGIRWIPDTFTQLLLGMVLLAALFPVAGNAAVVMGWITHLAIGLLFFLHGAKLSRAAILAGASHWRLHGLVFGCTFILFPLLGLMLRPLLEPWLGHELYVGVLYLCTLPATVQSSIAFTSLARGNVAAAVCSAAASSLLGIFLTPLLVALLLGVQGGSGSLVAAVGNITVQLLLPFVLGQWARGWIGAWVDRNKSWLKYVDQSSILLVVYLAFSEAVVAGLWGSLPLTSLMALLVACVVLLALALGLTWALAKLGRFSVEDQITILFCGSKKSLATGVPMAQVLFAGSSLGMLILPIMLFHQIQLMVCAVLARRYAHRTDA